MYDLTPPLLISHVDERLPGAVYIGRADPTVGLAASPYAEPVGDPRVVVIPAPPSAFRSAAANERTRAINRYHDHLLASPALVGRLPELRGRILACGCRRSGELRTPSTTCHGDVLVLWLATFEDATLRWLAGRPLPGGWADELATGVAGLVGADAALIRR